MKSFLGALAAVLGVWAICYFLFEYPRLFAAIVVAVLAYFVGVAHTSWSIFRERDDNEEAGDLPTVR